MGKKPKITAAELAQIQNDPERLKRVAVQEAEHELQSVRLREELEPLVGELRALGLKIQTLGGLQGRQSDLKVAFPVLLEHLKKPYSADALFSIGHLFDTKEARPHWDAIVSLYLNTTDDPDSKRDPWRSRLAVAIAEMATKSDLPLIEQMIRDPKLGRGRIFFIRPMIRLGRDKGWAVLQSLADDPALCKEIAFRSSEKARRERAKERRARE
jgi:hypothetical protein